MWLLALAEHFLSRAKKPKASCAMSLALSCSNSTGRISIFGIATAWLLLVTLSRLQSRKINLSAEDPAPAFNMEHTVWAAAGKRLSTR